MHINYYNKIPPVDLVKKSTNYFDNNNDISLIGICVSYNYLETLKIMLPINYIHFTRLYIITQKDDIKTIEYCKQFRNIEVVFFNFKTKKANFNKGAALIKLQKIIYNIYPDSWYFILDSDVILPINFLDILTNTNLDENTIYGGYRNNLNKLSDINMFYENNFNFDKHNKLLSNVNSRLIIGSFQLYKQKYYYQESDDSHFYGADYDIEFSNLFKHKQLLQIIYLHLGKESNFKEQNNWIEKNIVFRYDIPLDLHDFLFESSFKYGCLLENNWNISKQFKEHIISFFKNRQYSIISNHSILVHYFKEVFNNICVLNIDTKHINTLSTIYDFIFFSDKNIGIFKEIDVLFIDTYYLQNNGINIRNYMNNLIEKINIKYIIVLNLSYIKIEPIIENNTYLSIEKKIGLNSYVNLNNDKVERNEGYIIKSHYINENNLLTNWKEKLTHTLI